MPVDCKPIVAPATIAAVRVVVELAELAELSGAAHFAIAVVGKETAVEPPVIEQLGAVAADFAESVAAASSLVAVASFAVAVESFVAVAVGDYGACVKTAVGVDLMTGPTVRSAALVAKSLLAAGLVGPAAWIAVTANSMSLLVEEVRCFAHLAVGLTDLGSVAVVVISVGSDRRYFACPAVYIDYLRILVAVAG